MKLLHYREFKSFDRRLWKIGPEVHSLGKVRFGGFQVLILAEILKIMGA
jgi:hypothetical protein